MRIDNTGGNGRVVEGYYGDIFVYDTLPPIVRERLRDAPYDYDITEVAAAYKQFVSTPSTIHSFFDDDWDKPKTPTTKDFAADMDYNFRRDVMDMSYSKIERNGEYILRRLDTHARAGYNKHR